MSQAADRNLLFGIMALQMDFISKDTLVTAMNAWVMDKSKPLGQILVDQKALAADSHDLLEALVKKHLAMHGGDADKSLAAISSATAVRQDLEKIADLDVQASLVHVSPSRHGVEALLDPYATLAPFKRTAPPAGGLRFRILRPHARGGLGEVFVAKDEELHREVALKEIQDKHADNEQSRSRFVLEAEITSALEHPSIVPVYGLGTYANGRPYYAMRFIRGDSLKEAIEAYHKPRGGPVRKPGADSLELRALLGRFVDVCNAIAYAHARGVLHRDLKPGNIMLGKYGETLVVDWGLAKHLGEKLRKAKTGEPVLALSSRDMPTLTLMGSAVGTPQYMSPEQAAGLLDELGPASDVYSLGATLFCLLTGRPPLDNCDTGELLKRCQRGDIPRPRTIQPNVSPALEAICLTAMALEPENRYASPSLLASDIEHWLADEPVSAWPEPFTVKARRWIGRHRSLVTGIASAIVVAVFGLSAATVLLTAANEREREARMDAEEQEREAVRQKTKAVAEEQEARKQKMIAEGHEREALKQKAKAEQNFLLARQAVDRYHTEVSVNVLLNEPGMEPLRMKLLEAAREFYDKFVAERQDDPKLRGDLNKALFHLAQITADIDSEKKAIELHERAMEGFKSLVGANTESGAIPDYRRDLASSYLHLGRLYRKSKQISRSEAAYNNALVIWERLVPKNAEPEGENVHNLEGLAWTRNGLGNVAQLTRNLNTAVKFYEQAGKGWQGLASAHGGVDEYQWELAVNSKNLGMVLMALPGKEKEAETALRSAEKIQMKLVVGNPTISRYKDDLASTYYSLGALYKQTGATAHAQTCCLQAIEIWQEIIDRHPAVTSFHSRQSETYVMLSAVYRLGKDFKKAEEAAQQGLNIMLKLSSKFEDNPNVQIELAKAYRAQGDFYRSSQFAAKSEHAYDEALRITAKLARDVAEVPVHRSELARTHNHLGLLYCQEMKEDKAVEAFTAALSVWEKLVQVFPEEQEYANELSITCANLGKLARNRKKFDDAVGWFTRAVDALGERKVGGPPSDALKPGSRVLGPAQRDMLIDAHQQRAETLARMEKYGEAVADWDRLVALVPEKHTLFVRFTRADVLARAGDYLEAAAEVEILVKLADTGETSYFLARVSALSAAAASKDSKRSEGQRRDLSEKFEARAVKLLGEARDRGFFMNAAQLSKLATDSDWHVLRERTDFKSLLRELQSK